MKYIIRINLHINVKGKKLKSLEYESRITCYYPHNEKITNDGHKNN